MWNLPKTAFLVFTGLVISSSALGDETAYSNQFDHRVTYRIGTSQYDDWMSFRASLPTSDVLSITVSGSRDLGGRSCSNPVIAQKIVDAMRAGAAQFLFGTTTLSLNCDDATSNTVRTWNTGSCGWLGDSNNLELNVGTNEKVCACSDNYTVRPGIRSNANWGGIAGPTCDAPSQIMTVTVNFGTDTVTVTDTDSDGVYDDHDFCADTALGAVVDGVGCSDAQVDADGDSVCDPDAASGGPSMCAGIDYCADTMNPEAIVPTVRLKHNRWALMTSNDSDFDTITRVNRRDSGKGRGRGRGRGKGSGSGRGPDRSYSVGDTAGCSCEQIIEAQGLGKGHAKFGCSSGALDDWLELMH